MIKKKWNHEKTAQWKNEFRFQGLALLSTFSRSDANSTGEDSAYTRMQLVYYIISISFVLLYVETRFRSNIPEKNRLFSAVISWLWLLCRWHDAVWKWHESGTCVAIGLQIIYLPIYPLGCAKNFWTKKRYYKFRYGSARHIWHLFVKFDHR